jgi:hypothetical protein
LPKLLYWLALLVGGLAAASCGASARQNQSSTPTPDSEGIVAAACPVKFHSEIAPGSLGTLLPMDPVLNKVPAYCSLDSNDVVGAPDYGFFAPENELERLGRICGCSYGHYEALYVRIDIYQEADGAHEAFAQEASYLDEPPNKEVEEVDKSQLSDIGNERKLKQTFYSVNGQQRKHDAVLLMRRSNIIARMDFTPEQPVDLLLEYAAQLDRNIQAAAAANTATPPPQ